MERAKHIPKFLSACLNAARRGLFSKGKRVGLGAFVSVAPEITYTTDRTTKTGRKLPDGVEIRFGDNVPSPAVREKIKALGFKFSEKQQMWYAYDDAGTREFTATFAGEMVEATPIKQILGDKNWFWAKVKSEKDYKYIAAQAPFRLDADGGHTYYKNKSELDSALGYGKIMAAIKGGALYFKKFWTRVSTEGEAEPGEGAAAPANPAPVQPILKSIAEVVAQRLRGIADGMEKGIRHQLNPPIAQQRQTRRRAGIASGMAATGFSLLVQQNALYALAQAWEEGLDEWSGSCPAIALVRKRTEVGEILSYKARSAGTYSATTVPDILQKIGFSSLAAWEEAYNTLMSITLQWQQTGQSKGPACVLIPFRPAQNMRLTQLEQEIKAMERELIGRKITGFFPTPPDLIARMIDEADIQPGDMILEPSSGKGDILEAIWKSCKPSPNSLYGREINHTLNEICEKKAAYYGGSNGVTAWVQSCTDTLHKTPGMPSFDRILMNPPFENGQDIDHVADAYEHNLKPGGRLVAIMSEGPFYRSFHKDKEFRQWVEALQARGYATVSDKIQGAFSTKQSFNQTGVVVRLVSITKPNTMHHTPQNTMQSKEEDEELEMLTLEAEAELMLMKGRLEVLAAAGRHYKNRQLSGFGRKQSNHLTTLQTAIKRIRI